MVTAAITWVGVKDKRPTAPLPLLNLRNSAGLATLYLQFLLMLFLLWPMLLFPLATDPSTLLKNKVDVSCCLICVESPPISQSFLISNDGFECLMTTDAGRFVDKNTMQQSDIFHNFASYVSPEKLLLFKTCSCYRMKKEKKRLFFAI